MKREPFGTRRGRVAVTIIGIIAGLIYIGGSVATIMASLGY